MWAGAQMRRRLRRVLCGDGDVPGGVLAGGGPLSAPPGLRPFAACEEAGPEAGAQRRMGERTAREASAHDSRKRRGKAHHTRNESRRGAARSERGPCLVSANSCRRACRNLRATPRCAS